MSLRYGLTVLALALVAAGATFRLKHAVRGLDQELSSLEEKIEVQRWALRTARAEFAYLTRPERLALQAAQLGLVPARGERILAASDLPPKEGAQTPVTSDPLPARTALPMAAKAGPAWAIARKVAP